MATTTTSNSNTTTFDGRPKPTMQYAQLGKSGLRVSRICLGMMSYGSPAWKEWVLGYDASLPFIKAFLDAGGNFFDTAQVYSDRESERVLGRALAELKVPRESVVIATKIHPDMSIIAGQKPIQVGLSRKNIIASVEKSIEIMRCEYIDLFQLHRFDSSTPIEETLRALDDLVRAGKIRYIGMSSCYTWQFAKMQYEARRLGLTEFVSMQNHFNCLYREEEREMMPFCRSEGVGLIPWSPLARGVIARGRNGQHTARTDSDQFQHALYGSEDDYRVIDAIWKVAEARKHSPSQIALAWVLSRPGVTAPIIGATKMHHLQEAIDALTIKLTDEEIKAIEAPYVPHKIMGHA